MKLTHVLQIATAACIIALAAISPARADGFDAKLTRGTIDWSGVYVGVNAGYADGDVDVTNTNGGVLPGPFSYSTDGAFGGITAGYNRQLGFLLIGIEADAGYLDLSGDGIIPSSNPIYHQDITLDGGWYGDITGRIGFAVGPALIYGKGGLAVWDGEAKQATTRPGYQSVGTDTLTGTVIGGGIEYALTSNMSIKAEYLKFDFGTADAFQKSITDAPVGYVYTNEHDITADTFKVGLNVRY